MLLKKLGILIVLAAILVCYPNPASADVLPDMIYAGGQLTFKGGTTQGIGGGSDLKFGWILNSKVVSPRVIGWASWDQYKTNEALSTDHALVGASMIFPNVIPQIKAGLYFNGAIGGGKIPETPTEFSKFYGGGLFCELSNETNFWLGLHSSNVKNVLVYSAHAGLSWNIDWK